MPISISRNPLRMKYLLTMNRYWTVFLLVVTIGCGSPPPPPPPVVLPKDTIRVEPGPIDADAPEEFTTAESGLKYRIRRKSDGKKPTPADLVRVHYRGQFDDGTIFDSSYGRTGSAAMLPLNAVVKGWAEGLQLIGEGGMIELEIPPELGYGAAGFSSIPPNSTLHFLVELLEVKPSVDVQQPLEVKPQ